MSQAGANNTSGGGGGSGITTINGDSGSVTGAVVSFNAENIAGASVSFSGAGTLMSLNTSDSQLNTLIGQGTGGSTGTLNTALGTGSMITATGNENVAIGSSSLETTSGTLNVALGAFSLRSLTTGSSNVSIGDSSGINLTSGSNNTIISGGGNYTGAESNNIVIENAGVIGDSHTIRIGTQGTGTSQQDTCFVAGIAGVTVSNQEFVTIDSTTGQLGSSASTLTINADTGSISGNPLSFNAQNIAGASVSFDGSGSVMTLNTSDGVFNTLIGFQTGGIAGTENTALGYAAMQNASGNFNTAIGFNALGATSVGSSNVAIGLNSLGLATSADSNVAIGSGSAINLGEGINNVIIGASSGGSYNGSESDNILISNAGVIGESGVMRLGTTGTITNTFVAGISGVPVANQQNVTVNSATGQMGSFSASPFYAYLGTTASNVTGDTALVGPIIFNTVAAGSSPNYSGSSGFFTAPANGWYTFQCSITFMGGTTIDRWRVDFYGSAFIEQGVSLQPSAPITNATQILSASITIPMTAGDEIGIGALASGDATKTVSIGGGAPGSGNSTSSFSGYRIS